MTCSSQSDCFISAQHSFASFKFVYGILDSNYGLLTFRATDCVNCATDVTTSLNVFFKWANPGLFLFIFSLFKQYNFYNKSIKKCPSSIQRRDWNPQPFENELSPIITRPGLPPTSLNVILSSYF